MNNLLSLPLKLGPQSDAQILQFAKDGTISFPALVPVAYQRAEHSVTIFATPDAVMLDGVRVCVTHPTAQLLADTFDLMLPTSCMSDQAWIASQSKIPPQPQTTAMMAGQGANTAVMVLHSRAVDSAMAAAGVTPGTGTLVRPVGKDWVNTERLLTASGERALISASSINPSPPPLPASANFGWQTSPQATRSRSPGGVPVLQSVGLAHGLDHVDYSQVVCLYGKVCQIDGGTFLVEEVMADPDRAFLLSDEVKQGQVARVMRLPPPISLPVAGVRRSGGGGGGGTPSGGEIPTGDGDLGKLIAGGAGLVAGYFGGRYLSRRFSRLGPMG